MNERAIATRITADRVLIKLWERATADPRELVEYRIGSCRHCWGMYHRYQYTDAEYSAAQDKHIREEARKAKKKPDHAHEPFQEKGGSGYVHDKPPNPKCPECWGRGEGLPLVHDTRGYSDGAKSLYAGIKVRKDGVINIQMESRTEALQLIGRHLGMWNDKIKITDETNPLQALLDQIQAAHSTVPIVHDDPERRAAGPGDIEDVEPRAPGRAPGQTPAPGAAAKWRPA